MKKIFFLCLITLPLYSFCQSVDTLFVLGQIDSLISETKDLWNNGKYQESISFAEEAKKLAQDKIGEKTAIFAKCLNTLGICYYLLGKYDITETYFIETRDLRKKILGEMDSDYMGSLNNIAALYVKMGKYDLAEKSFLEIKEIWKYNSNGNPNDHATFLNNLATFYRTLGRYKDAKTHYQSALTIWKKLIDKQEVNYIQCLTNLSVVYRKLSQYNDAYSYGKEAIERSSRKMGSDNINYAVNIISFANLLVEIGKYEEAENFYLLAKRIYEKGNEVENPDYPVALQGLADLYQYLGLLELSEHLLNDVKKMYGKFYPENHPHHAMVLNNLANIYRAQGAFNKAEIFYNNAKEIWKINYGEKHTDFATSLNNLGIVYINQKRYKEAEVFLEKSKNIRLEIFGRDHYLYAYSLSNLAMLYEKISRLTEAEVLRKEVIEIRENLLGKKHQLYAFSLFKLGHLQWKRGMFKSAESTFLESNSIQKELMINSRQYLSEKELVNNIKEINKNFEVLYSFTYLRSEQSINLLSLSFDNALTQKNYLFNSTIQVNNFPQTSVFKKDKFQLLKSYHRRLAIEYTKPIVERKNVDSLEIKANILEKELVRTVAGFGDAIKQVNWQEVQANLQANEVAIEFIHYNFSNPNPRDSTIYAALVLRPEDKQPHFVPLFEEKQLQKLLSDHSGEKIDYFNRLYKSNNHQSDLSSLYQLIWKPLDSLISAAQTVYIAPSGLLHRINLGAIMVDQNACWTDHHKLVLLNSTRQLVMKKEISNNDSLTAVLYGGIRYDMDSTAIASANENFVKENFFDEGLSFSFLNRSDRGTTFGYLEGTAKEVDQINTLFDQQDGNTQLLKSYWATEESFKQLGQNQPSPRVVHLATHGYFYPDPTDDVKNMDAFNEFPAFKISDNPMIRSGLVFAGANHVWQGNSAIEDMEDGILTAYEASQVNLKNTDLVVLSACETGLGDIEGNEGVYGLQRAFKIAGAKNLIMSLWSVPDKQTQEMMVAFYDFWLTSKMDINDAFRAAQKQIREKYKGHYYWAGFVLIE